jgi:hypothetical protein
MYSLAGDELDFNGDIARLSSSDASNTSQNMPDGRSIFIDSRLGSHAIGRNS